MPCPDKRPDSITAVSGSIAYPRAARSKPDLTRSVVVDGGINDSLSNVAQLAVGVLRRLGEVTERLFTGVPMFRHQDAFGLLNHPSGPHRRLQLLDQLGRAGVEGGVGHGHCGIAGEGL